MSSPTLHKRFIEERVRLGHGTGLSLAGALEVVASTISKIERGVVSPSAALLAAFADLGADVGYVLTGTRSGRIDLQLLGASEAHLRAAFTDLVGVSTDGRNVRPRMTALVYNRVVGRIGPGLEETIALREAARELLTPMDDPAERDMLEKSLFISAAEKTAPTGVVVSGDGNRVAGRDMIGGGKKRTKG